MYANILLSADGSDVARKGVEHGIALAKALNAKVTVITVTEPFPVYGGGDAVGFIPTKGELDRFDAACKERAGKVLDEARAMAEQIGISAELLHVPNAHPATAIIETSKSRGCDLIVMASHGHRGFRKLLLGSQWVVAREPSKAAANRTGGLATHRAGHLKAKRKVSVDQAGSPQPASTLQFAGSRRARSAHAKARRRSPRSG